jgi:hypothetical protein
MTRVEAPWSAMGSSPERGKRGNHGSSPERGKRGKEEGGGARLGGVAWGGAVGGAWCGLPLSDLSMLYMRRRNLRSTEPEEEEEEIEKKKKRKEKKRKKKYGKFSKLKNF